MDNHHFSLNVLLFGVINNKKENENTKTNLSGGLSSLLSVKESVII